MLHPSEWHLTPKQTDLMDTLIEFGALTIVAKRLNKSYHTVKAHIEDIRNAAGATDDDNIVMLALAWDRYTREKAK